ncbi:hypothetical protein M1L60_33415 [Actinoplanes sp. TRM 88003]|uniref:Uncharacterized protein n=1 Tax=Paractinoplanes aksuensis TaxID=2939490 RepID=A0ABT1DXC0_9ACTN|nr:hypothetical protein [Actinoplanes aksuensis]MCO8275494.1 hypothetical protein [Actinoplanes aksuensis]
MTGLNTAGSAPRPVWRRSTARPAVTEEPEPIFCGGPDRTVDDIFQEMREYKRLWDEERAKEEAEKKKQAAKKDDDEDDDAALERFRKDRYAVGLLKQDTGAWGDGPQYSGTLG